MTTLISHESHKLWVPMLPALLSNLATNLGVSTIPLQVKKCIRMTQNTEKHYWYTYNDYFIIKVTNEQQDRVILRAAGLKGSWVQSCAHQDVHQPGKCSKLTVESYYLGLIRDQLISHMIELNL